MRLRTRSWSLGALGVGACLVLVGCADVGPSPTPSLNDLSDEQLAQSTLDQAWTQFAARFPDVERPSIERVRYIDIGEWPTVIGDCMHTEGFTQVGVNAFGDGIDFGEVPAEQEEAFELARYVCTARYPLDPKISRPLDDDQISRLYDYYVGEHIKCLEELGYTIPEPPTRQSFIETYATQPWLPIQFAAQQARALGMDAMVEMMRTCPQLPEGLWN
ncbi:MAG TPA: hypothetical protein VNR37_03610 [Microbacteriaceae bacterium]|nr:hypothetical protein [Microbacteriaceae bacterium]